MKANKLFPAKTELEFWAQNLAHEFYKKGLELFHLVSVGNLQIKFFHHKSTTAGWAVYNRHEIWFNAALLAQEKESFRNTISHEVAHILSVLRYGEIGKGHGRFWKDTWLRIDPNARLTRCHNYDSENIGRKSKYNYKWIHADTGETLGFLARNRRFQLGLNPHVWLRNNPSTKGKMFLVKI